MKSLTLISALQTPTLSPVVPHHRLPLRAAAWQISPSLALPLQSAIPIPNPNPNLLFSGSPSRVVRRRALYPRLRLRAPAWQVCHSSSLPHQLTIPIPNPNPRCLLVDFGRSPADYGVVLVPPLPSRYGAEIEVGYG